MSPNHSFILNPVPMEPVSRTYQYRKIMKPMLERKRRARINKCLDELKELMATAMQSEGENVSKLEKADILELTVRHLHSLKEKNSLYLRQDRTKVNSFWDGFRHCASEVSQYLSKYDQNISTDLLSYINRCAKIDTVNLQSLSSSLSSLPSVSSVSASASSLSSSSAATTAIAIRSDAYLFGAATTYRYENLFINPQINLRQQNSINCGQFSSRIIESKEEISEGNVWRPW